MGDSPETPRARFSSAKKDARAAFDSMARQLAAICIDAATFKSRLDDEVVNARACYVANKNPAWNDVSPEVELDTGRASIEGAEAELLAEKLEYEKNLKYLEAWFPTRKEYWLERYARERRNPVLRVISDSESNGPLNRRTTPKALLGGGPIVPEPPPDTSGITPGWEPTIIENEAGVEIDTASEAASPALAPEEPGIAEEKVDQRAKRRQDAIYPLWEKVRPPITSREDWAIRASKDMETEISRNTVRDYLNGRTKHLQLKN